MNKRLQRVAAYLGENGLYKEAAQIQKLAGNKVHIVPPELIQLAREYPERIMDIAKMFNLSGFAASSGFYDQNPSGGEEIDMIRESLEEGSAMDIRFDEYEVTPKDRALAKKLKTLISVESEKKLDSVI